MSDIYIEDRGSGWDLELQDGDLVLTDKVSRFIEVRQRVVYNLMTWLGESPYDPDAGVAYLDVVFGSTPDANVVAYLTSFIEGTEGVDAVIEPPTFDLSNGRVLSINAFIRVGAEDGELFVEVAR